MGLIILGMTAVTGAACGWMDARQDAALIAAGNAIDHADGLSERAAICVVLSALFTVIGERVGETWWFALPVIGVWAGSFGIVFRWSLNRMRGLEWDYVSLSNRYDTLFIGLFGKLAGAMEYGLHVSNGVASLKQDPPGLSSTLAAPDSLTGWSECSSK